MTATTIDRWNETTPRTAPVPTERAASREAALAAWGTTVLRVTLGTIFAAHGAQKLFSYGLSGVTGAFGQMGIPFPALSAVLATSAELLGGAALILGLFTRLATIPLAFTMVVALTMVHLGQGFFLPNGFEYTFALLGATIAVGLLGPGRAAVDGRLGLR
jgi:putative oxidoreductase